MDNTQRGDSQIFHYLRMYLDVRLDFDSVLFSFISHQPPIGSLYDVRQLIDH